MDLISRLSELRCQYNCFDESERDAYHTLSEAIKALSDVPDTNVGDCSDCIKHGGDWDCDHVHCHKGESAQPEQCEYYALCRHGRDESKLRARLKFCEYCHEDSDGYVTPIEKNNHAFVRFGMDGWELSLKANGWHGSAKIRFCPMCGRELKDDAD